MSRPIPGRIAVREMTMAKTRHDLPCLYPPPRQASALLISIFSSCLRIICSYGHVHALKAAGCATEIRARTTTGSSMTLGASTTCLQIGLHCKSDHNHQISCLYTLLQIDISSSRTITTNDLILIVAGVSHLLVLSPERHWPRVTTPAWTRHAVDRVCQAGGTPMLVKMPMRWQLWVTSRNSSGTLA